MRCCKACARLRSPFASRCEFFLVFILMCFQRVLGRLWTTTRRAPIERSGFRWSRCWAIRVWTCWRSEQLNFVRKWVSIWSFVCLRHWNRLNKLNPIFRTLWHASKRHLASVRQMRRQVVAQSARHPERRLAFGHREHGFPRCRSVFNGKQFNQQHSCILACSNASRESGHCAKSCVGRQLVPAQVFVPGVWSLQHSGVRQDLERGRLGVCTALESARSRSTAKHNQTAIETSSDQTVISLQTLSPRIYEFHKQVSVFQLRVYVLWARELHSPKQHISRAFVRVFFLNRCQQTCVIEDLMNPIWNETLIFKRVTIDC